jgi:DNA repair exonuclease SbcCD ATPase subunit
MEEGLRRELVAVRAKLQDCERTLRQHEEDRADPFADTLERSRADLQTQLSAAIKGRAGLADMLMKKQHGYDELEGKYRAMRGAHREQLEANALLTRQLSLALELAADAERMREQVADAERRLDAAMSEADVAQLVGEFRRMTAAANAGAADQAEQIASLQEEVRTLRQAAATASRGRVVADLALDRTGVAVDEAVPPPAHHTTPPPSPRSSRTELIPATSPAAKGEVLSMVMSRFDDPVTQEEHGHAYPR